MNQDDHLKIAQSLKTLDRRLILNTSAIKAENGHYIITHSESGHHHVVEERPDIQQFSGMDIFTGFLNITGDEPTQLKHLRSEHNHATQVVSPGAWLIQRQRGYTPEGWVRAQD